MASPRSWKGKMNRDMKIVSVRNWPTHPSLAGDAGKAIGIKPCSSVWNVLPFWNFLVREGFAQRSSGRRPVRLEMRASIRGPSSSWFRNAKTTFGQPSRANTLWGPVWRLTFQPMRSNEASTRLAFVDGHALPRLHIAAAVWESHHHSPAGPREPAGPGPLLWRSRGVGSLHRPLRLVTLAFRPSTGHRFPARSRCATSGSPPKPPPMRAGGS